MNDDMNKILDRLRGLCSRREYCSSDIYKKALDALDKDTGKAREVLEILVREKYVDDLRYASAFARDKSSIAGWGDVKIRYMLSAKGIPKDIIAQALEDIDRNRSGSRLEKLVENKYRSLKDDPQCRLKLLRFILGRGYAYEEAVEAIKAVSAMNGSEADGDEV